MNVDDFDVNDLKSFHSMDPALVPFVEDPKEVLVRDWPPQFAMYLRYKPTGTYLAIKRGSLCLRKTPYVTCDYYFLV